MVDRPPLTLLTDAERRGAMIALQHIRAHAERIARQGTGRGYYGRSTTERILLTHAASMIKNTAKLVDRDLNPDPGDVGAARPV